MRPIHAQQGFSLIELMIAVAVVGILAALALASYDVARQRAHVAEGLTFLSPYKQDVAEQVQTIGRLPNEASDPADVDYFETGGSGVVRRVRWSRGRSALEVWFGSGAGDKLNGAILWLSPTLQADGGLTWRCSGHPEAAYYLEPRYLPASCRQ